MSHFFALLVTSHSFALLESFAFPVIQIRPRVVLH